MKRVWKSIKKVITAPWAKRGAAPSERTAAIAGHEPVTLPRDKHCISRKDIDPDALKILYRLRKFNHTAYLVGGGVRDLLLGIKAKDFDISTSAHPNEIKRMFSNCRLVGKRFRLAHILFRGKFIEVSTFRKQSEFDIEGDDLLVRSDNTWGTPEEDAFRRDFTINGLFYSLDNFTVLDYVGGLKDLEARLIRSIGDPNVRFREDPIRMLRAIRLAARLDFQIEQPCMEAIASHRSEVWKAATPRILEELSRMLATGHSRRSFALLFETGLLEMLLPELSIVLMNRGMAPDFWKLLEAADNVVQGGTELSFPVLYTNLLAVLYRSKTEHTVGPVDHHTMIEETLHPIALRLGIPRRHVDRAKSILMAQRRFPAIGRKGFQPGPFAHRPYFREALDLFRIQAHTDPAKLPLVDRWLQHAPAGPPRRPERERYARREEPRRTASGAPREPGRDAPGVQRRTEREVVADREALRFDRGSRLPGEQPPERTPRHEGRARQQEGGRPPAEQREGQRSGRNRGRGRGSRRRGPRRPEGARPETHPAESGGPAAET